MLRLDLSCQYNCMVLNSFVRSYARAILFFSILWITIFCHSLYSSMGYIQKLSMSYFSINSSHVLIVLVFNSSAYSSMSLCIPGMYAILPYIRSDSFSIRWVSFSIPVSISTASLQVPYSQRRAVRSIFLSTMSYFSAISSLNRSLTHDFSP